MSRSPQELKACCASAYASAAARWLLGDSFHPGGAELTSRLVTVLGVGAGATIVDVACGPGTSALQAVRETGSDVVGVDYSEESVARAREQSRAEGLEDRVRFVVGDAEDLPFADESFDGALCECSFCTFPDKRAAAREIARVLRPSARLALADVTADLTQLPATLRTLEAWIACLADARPLLETVALLREAGFEVESVEAHDEALADLLDRIDERLRPLGLGIELLDAARRAVDRGTLGYGVVLARKRGSGNLSPDAAAAYEASKTK